MVLAGRLFGDSGLIHGTSNGLVVGWSTGGVPTWSGDSGVTRRSTTLRGFGPSYESTRWEFGIDEYTIFSVPLIAGSHTFTSMTDGTPHRLMALRLGDGARVWCLPLTDQPPARQSGSPPRPVAPGAGLLFVSIGSALAAYESGGPPSDCAAPPTPATATPQRSAPQLRLVAGRRTLTLGRRTKLVARLVGLARAGGRPLAIDVDVWPFDDRYRTIARGRTAADGTFTRKYAPRRNARLRARMTSEPRLASERVTVYADHRMRVRRRDAGGERPRLRVTIEAPRGADVRTRAVYGYLARGSRPWRRVARGRWQLAVAPLPRLHQRVREQRQGARLALAVAHQHVHETGLEVQAGAHRRLLDRLAQAVARERADEMQAPLDQAAELRIDGEAAEIITAHRDHHRPVTPGTLDDAADKRSHDLGPGAEREQLLELVDQHRRRPRQRRPPS